MTRTADLIPMILVSAVVFSLLVPLAFSLGLVGDDWNELFGVMQPDVLFENIIPSIEFWLLLQRFVPMQVLSMTTLHWLFGAEPTGYFIFAFMAKAMAGILLGYLVLRFTNDQLAALAAAVVWLTLPVGSQGLYSMAAGTGKWQGSIYLIVSMLFYLHALEANRRQWLWGLFSALLFALAFLSYEQAFMFLPVYPLIHWIWSRQTVAARIFAGWFWVHAAVGAAYLYVRVFVVGALQQGHYRISTSSLSSPFETLINLAENPKINLLISHYGHILTAFKQPMNFLNGPGIGLGLTLILCAWLVLKRTVQRDYSESEAPAGDFTGLLTLAVLGLVVFIATQAMFLFVSPAPEGRTLIIPTIGTALVAAAVVGFLHRSLRALGRRPVVWAGQVVLVAAIAVAGTLLGTQAIENASPYTKAGTITRTVHNDLKKKAGTFTPGQKVVILGTPWLARTPEGWNWVFTANYAMSGMVGSAFNRPPDISDYHGFMTFEPTSQGFFAYMKLRSPVGEGYAGYIHNFYGAADRFPNYPIFSFDKLALYLFDGRRLQRVKTLAFQDVHGRWYRRSLTNRQEGIEFRYPRIGKVVQTPDLMPGSFPLNMNAGPLTLATYGNRGIKELLDVQHVQLTWEKSVSGKLEGRWDLSVTAKSADGERLFNIRSAISQKEVSRQLGNVDWKKGMILQQDLIFSDLANVPMNSLVGQVDFLDIRLDQFGADNRLKRSKRRSVVVSYGLAGLYENKPPVISSGNPVVKSGKTVAVSSLFVVNDAEGDTTTKYVLTYYGNGDGYLSVDGVRRRLGEYIHVNAGALSTVRYTAGKTGTVNGFWVRAYDGRSWGEWKDWNVTAQGE